MHRDMSMYCKCAALTAPETESHKQTIQIPSMVLMYSLTSLAGVSRSYAFTNPTFKTQPVHKRLSEDCSKRRVLDLPIACDNENIA